MNTTMTSGQLALQIKLFEEKGMTPERWNLILSSGFFADLCDANADLGDRDTFRQALKLGTALPETFILEVNYDEGFEQMVAAGHYNWVNSNITAKHLGPKEGNGIVQCEAKVFHFDRSISSKDAIEAMKAEGFEPAQTEHLLAFGAKYPDEQRKYPIVALRSVAGVGGDRRVPVLGRYGAKRFLSLYWFGGGWGARSRFLAVRPLFSGPQV